MNLIDQLKLRPFNVVDEHTNDGHFAHICIGDNHIFTVKRIRRAKMLDNGGIDYPTKTDRHGYYPVGALDIRYPHFYFRWPKNQGGWREVVWDMVKHNIKVSYSGMEYINIVQILPLLIVPPHLMLPVWNGHYVEPRITCYDTDYIYCSDYVQWMKDNGYNPDASLNKLQYEYYGYGTRCRMLSAVLARAMMATPDMYMYAIVDGKLSKVCYTTYMNEEGNDDCYTIALLYHDDNGLDLLKLEPRYHRAQWVDISTLDTMVAWSSFDAIVELIRPTEGLDHIWSMLRSDKELAMTLYAGGAWR